MFRSYTYPEYDPLITYAKDAIVIVAVDHKKYLSLQGTNLNHPPAGTTPDLWWSVPSNTAPWTPFDAKIGSQVERTGSLKYTLTPGDIVAGISFFQLSASSIDITMTDPTEGVVYEKTINLISTSNVFDAYSYYFAPFLRTRNTAKIDLPPYRNAVITLSINAGSDTSTAKCGEIVFGPSQYAGDEQYEPSMEIVDWSTNKTDLWGNVETSKKPVSKKINIEMTIANSILPSVIDFMEDYRSTPVVWIGVETIEDVKSVYLIYGRYSRASTVLKYLSTSLILIEITGMT